MLQTIQGQECHHHRVTEFLPEGQLAVTVTKYLFADMFAVCAPTPPLVACIQCCAWRKDTWPKQGHVL